MELDKTRIAACSTFLFDIEGTICSIAFVKDVLYPYFLTALPSYLANNFSTPTLQSLLPQLPASIPRTPAAAQAHFESLVASDTKDPILKALQGHIWTAGYTSGEITAPLYPDVIPFFRCVRGNGFDLAIYSSGSVKAQRLLFDHVDAGCFPGSDAHETALISAPEPRPRTKSVSITQDFCAAADAEPRFFDTHNAGPKTDAASYTAICGRLNVDAEKVAFFTDNPAEAVAARAAGLYVVVLLRPGNAALSEDVRREFACVNDFGCVEQAVRES